MPADFTLAQHYVTIDQPKLALEALSGADGDAMESTEFWRLRALAHYELDEPAEAARSASEGLQRNPEAVDLLVVLALAEAERDDLAAAERAALAALHLDPEDPYVLCAYARVLARAGQLDKAEQIVDLAARSDPYAREAPRTRALIELLRGHNRKVAQISEEMLVEDPEDAAAHRMRGVALVNTGDAHGARDSLGTAVRDDPTDQALADVARSARAATHPLLWPMLPLQRLGVAGSWVAAITIIFGLRALGLDGASTVASFVWIALVAYSWLAAPAIERRLSR